MGNRKEDIISILLTEKGMDKLLTNGYWQSSSWRNYKAIGKASVTAKTHGHVLTVHFISSTRQIYVVCDDKSLASQSIGDHIHVVRITIPPKGTRMVFENNLPADVLQGGEHLDDDV